MSPQPSAFFGGFRRIFWSTLRFGPPDDDMPSNPPSHMPRWLPYRIDTVDVWPDAFLEQAVPLDKAKALRLVKLEQYKLPRTHDVGRHELVVAWLCDTLEHKEGRPANDRGYIIIRVERRSDAKDHRSGTAGAVSGSDQGCGDEIRFPTLADYERRVKARYDLVRVIEFPNDGKQPNVVDLAAILETVSKAGPKYNLYSTMCIWFAGTAFDVVCKLFESSAQPRTVGVARAGMIGPFPVYKPREVDEDAAVRAERMLEQEQAGGAKGQLTWDEKERENVVRRSIQGLPPFRQIAEDSKKRIEELEGALERIAQELREQEEEALEKVRQEGREQGLQQGEQARLAVEQERDVLRARLAQYEPEDGGR